MVHSCDIVSCRGPDKAPGDAQRSGLFPEFGDMTGRAIANDQRLHFWLRGGSQGEGLQKRGMVLHWVDPRDNRHDERLGLTTEASPCGNPFVRCSRTDCLSVNPISDHGDSRFGKPRTLQPVCSGHRIGNDEIATPEDPGLKSDGETLEPVISGNFKLRPPYATNHRSTAVDKS